MKIKTKELDLIFGKELDPILVDGLGFSFDKGTYTRALENGIVQMVILDVKSGKESCRVMLGVNATFLIDTPPYGALFVQYLTPGAITENPAEIRWKDRASLEKAVSLIAQAMRKHLGPWLERYSNLQAFAESIRPEYDYFKSLAYLRSGSPENAKLWLHRYRSRILHDEPSKEQEAALRQVEGLLAQV